MTTLRDLIRDVLIDVRNQGVNEYSCNDGDLDEKLDELIETIKERIVG